MKRSNSIFLALLLAWSFRLVAQDPTKEAEQSIRKGNDLYKQQQFQTAEVAYNEAIEKDKKNTTAKFNRANALYRQTKPSDAIKALQDLAFKAETTDMKAKAYYNEGAILSGQKRLEESIEAYKNALRQDPNDKEARENLQKALLELKKKDPPPKKDDKQKQQQKKQQQQQPKMNQKEAEQRLKLLEQKEKDVQERLQKEKSKNGGGQGKDW